MDEQQDPNGTFQCSVFLIGMPRSGTKLLRDLLNRHPKIRIPEAETVLLPYFVKNWQAFGDLRDEKNFHRFFKRFSRHFFFENLRKRGRLMSEQKWRSYIREYSAAGIFEALVRAETDNPPGSQVIWGDKSPSYVEHLAMIAKQFPHARFIHIVRDVRDYCLSISKAWGKNMLRAAFRWGQGVLKAKENGGEITSRYLEVHYERLIESPKAELERVCEFLGVQFVPDMLILEKPSENFGDTRGRIEIVATNKGKFKEQLDAGKVKEIEELSFPAMKAYGYEPLYASDFRPPSRLRLLLQRACDGYNLAIAVRREHGLLRGVMLHILHSRINSGLSF